MSSSSLTELFAELSDLDPIVVVDVGASALGQRDAFQPLVDRGRARVIGFEANPEEHRKLVDTAADHAEFLPYAVGDGTQGTLRVCRAPGMTSLLEPRPDVLTKFHGFGQWGEVLERRELQTHRLDDIPELPEDVDFVKLDVQGGELGVIEGGTRILSRALVVHTEAQLVPFYEDQPLFGELDLALRGAGFWFHRFAQVSSRTFRPLMVDEDVFKGLSQELWADAVYVRRFTDLARLTDVKLWKLALVLHDVYASVDFVHLVLNTLDERRGTTHAQTYLADLTGSNP